MPKQVQIERNGFYLSGKEIATIHTARMIWATRVMREIFCANRRNQKLALLPKPRAQQNNIDNEETGEISQIQRKAVWKYFMGENRAEFIDFLWIYFYAKKNRAHGPGATIDIIA